MCGTGTKNTATHCTCRCRCTAAASPVIRPKPSRPALSPDSVINLDHGDPTMYEAFWENVGDTCRVEIPGFQSMSYFSDAKNLCWFMEPELGEAIKNLHRVVGNAVVDGHHVVVGTGSSQLFQAALYALCSSSDMTAPVNVVCALPYYSCYPEVTDFLRSRLYKWAGDAKAFDKDGPFVELVTSPNNPDGFTREPVVVNHSGQGKVVHDLAYYWPQYTPITHALDHDIMLFTVSKCTGHAGSRLGWAVVKDEEVARKMVKFMELSTIGVSKESQLRAAKILQVINQSYQECESDNSKVEKFFEFGQNVMSERWRRLREVVERSDIFSLPNYPTHYCCFSGHFTEAHPGFAWLKCNKEGEDCAALLRRHKTLSRSGTRFGVGAAYARVSLLDREETFNLFLQRLAAI